MRERVGFRIAHLVLCGALLVVAPSRAQGAPTEATPEDRARHLVVMIDAVLGGGSRFGAGIVVGIDLDHELVYIATANHLVREIDEDGVYREAHDITVRFDRPSGLPFEALLLPPHDRNLDLAVIVVQGRAIPNFPALAARVPFEQVGSAADVRRGDSVRRLGNDRKMAWSSPVAPGLVSAVGATKLSFETNFIAGGASGGGLFTADWNLIGMVTSDLPPDGEAVRLDVIVATLASSAWEFPIGLGRQTEPTLDDRKGGTDLERPELHLRALSQSVEHMHIGLERTGYWFNRLRAAVPAESPSGQEEATCQALAAIVSEIRESVIPVRREQVRARDLFSASEQLLSEIRAGDTEIGDAMSADEQEDLLSHISRWFFDMATVTEESLSQSRATRGMLLGQRPAQECHLRISEDLLNLEAFVTLLGKDHEGLAVRLQALHEALLELGVEPGGAPVTGEPPPQVEPPLPLVEAPLRLVVRGVPTEDPRVRLALLLAVAWDALPAAVAEVAFGESQADWTASRPSFDPERASMLMAEAGWPVGVHMELRLAEAATVPVVRTVEALAAGWSAIGTTSVARGTGGTAAAPTVTVDVLSYR